MHVLRNREVRAYFIDDRPNRHSRGLYNIEKYYSDFFSSRSELNEPEGFKNHGNIIIPNIFFKICVSNHFS